MSGGPRVPALVLLALTACSVPLAPGPATRSWGYPDNGQGSGGEGSGGALTSGDDAGDAMSGADGHTEAGDAGLE